MGGKTSKPESEVSGTKDITIVQNQEVHTEMHQAHELKLNLLVVLVTVIIVLKCLKHAYRFAVANAKKQALKTFELPR